MKEVTPKELCKLNAKSFKETQKIFRLNLRKIAKSGKNKAKYNENNFCAGNYIADWLRNLGFTVKRVDMSGCYEITWEDNELLDSRRLWYMMTQKGDHKQSLGEDGEQIATIEDKGD